MRSVVKKTKGIKFEVIVVDNNSADGSVAALENLKPKVQNLRLIKNKENKGFSGANNQGMEVAVGRYFLFLNSDTLIHDNVLGEMVGWMEKNPKVGVATCALKNGDGSSQATGGYFPNLIRVFSCPWKRYCGSRSSSP